MGKATVCAWGSATVCAYDWATVCAYDRANVRAFGYANVRALRSSTVHASQSVTVTISPAFRGKVSGGRQIRPKFETVQDWCAFYGLPIINGVVVLYKGVGTDYKSIRGGNYTPGTTPEASDWDGGKEECGRGLHFSPSPGHTLEFDNFPSCVKRFIACPVRVRDISFHPDGLFPQKVKAKGCCAPVWEVDIDGKPL